MGVFQKGQVNWSAWKTYKGLCEDMTIQEAWEFIQKLASKQVVALWRTEKDHADAKQCKGCVQL